MKFNCKQAITYTIGLAALFCCLTSNVAQQASAEENEQTRILATITCPSEDSLWKATEKLATEMHSAQLAASIRAIVEMKFDDLEKLDSSKSFGLAVATNGTDVIPFAFLPVNQEKFTEDDLNSLKEKVKSQGKNVDIEVVLKDSVLFCTLSKFKDALSADACAQCVVDAQENDSTVVTATLNISSVPKEFIEAGFAALRQKIAENASSQTDEQLENLDFLLKCYSKIIDSIDVIKASIVVEEDNSLAFNCSVSAKPNSDLAKQFAKNKAATTRWSAVLDTNDAILVSISDESQFEGLKEYQARQFKDVACQNLLNQLDVLIDDPENFEFAKQLVALLEEEGLASLELDAVDAGFAMGADPDVIKFGCTVAKPEGLKKALQLIVERVGKEVENVDKYVTLDAETIEGFSVSKVNVPIFEIAPATPEYLKGKSIVAWMGIDSQSVAMVCGLNESEVQAEFTKLVAGTKEVKPAPTSSFFDLKPACVLFNKLCADCDDITTEAKETIAKLAEYDSLRFVEDRQIDENTLSVKLTVDKNVFKALGEIIKSSLTGAKPQGEDDSQDLDDVFEE